MKTSCVCWVSTFYKYTRCHICSCHLHCIIALLITLDYPCSLILNSGSIYIAVLGTVYFLKVMLYCCNVVWVINVDVINVDRLLSVHFDDIRFSNLCCSDLEYDSPTVLNPGPIDSTDQGNIFSLSLFSCLSQYV